MYASTSNSNGSSGSNQYLLDCFPTPPTTQHVSFPMSHLRYHHHHSVFSPDFSGALGLSLPTTTSSSSPQVQAQAYSPPAVISLGEEWTDQDDSDRPSSSSSPSSSPADLSDRSPSSSLDVFGDSDSYFAFSPTSSTSSLSPELPTEQLPLWQAEHPRLVSIRDAVLSSERAARYREACLESEVARIKDDLARVKEARARAPFRRNSAPAIVRRASDSDVATTALHSSWFSIDDDLILPIDDLPADSPGQFWDEHYPDPESMLSTHLTEARSARAEERRKRKRDHERIRELGILLSLGSEVRQWEERLAWENAFRPNHDDDDDDAMEIDHVDALRRRARSLPTTPPSGSSPSSWSSLTPPLPPLSASPLWRVSAEMILRRRSLSERPRRITPVTHESAEEPVGASANGTGGGGDDSGGGARSHPISISIPSSAPLAAAASSLRSAPSRPSALKLSFTLEDLVAPEEAAAVEKMIEDAREDEGMCNSSSEESSEASDSDDSRCKSSSSNSSSSENENERDGEKPLALRRGRSRWSWRKSLQSAQPLQQLAVDMEVDDA